jgi:hypothetical protein
MKCPYCESETQKGTVFFTGVGFNSFCGTNLSFVSEEEMKKSFVKRQTKDHIVMSGDIEADYCPACNKIIVGFEVEELE